jgi:peptidoglycan/LPS O-acetylase OafA/YrhL
MWPRFVAYDPQNRHVAALDGIRGLAVLFVFAYHALITNERYGGAVRHGYLGVQVFFVLSGFLITGRLFALSERAELTSWHKWRLFATRRAARIAPLYYAVLAFLAVNPGHLLPSIPRSAWPWLLTLTTNFGKLIVEETIGPGHLWSLCVEEQYYLVFPLLVLTALRRRLGAITLALVLAAPVMRSICSSVVAHRLTYHLPFMHFDSFGAGVMAAMIARDGHVLGVSPRAFHVVGALGWIALVALMVSPPVFGGSCLQTALSFGTASVVLAMHAGTLRGVAALLGSWPLVTVGRVSYGLYLFHPFVLRALPDALRSHPELRTVIALALSVALAALSFHFFEKPILAWAHRATQPNAPALRPVS